ncbi:MAG: RNA methyltransferase [Candidatus Puniceispirillales bacterium WSBS_2018_MAG_OTU23]
MRGYSALGVENVSKPRNAGAVIRTAHAFDAAFAFTVGETLKRREIAHSDTSKAMEQIPLYMFASPRDLALPEGCQLVGVELTDDAAVLPSFRHPRQAAYILGSERMGLSVEMQDLCDHIIKIPTRFSLNLAVAGAIIMYDRLQSMGGFAPRPTVAGGKIEQPPEPVFGEPLWMKKERRRNCQENK